MEAYKKAESLGFFHHEKEVSEQKRLRGESTTGRAETGKQWKSELTRVRKDRSVWGWTRWERKGDPKGCLVNNHLNDRMGGWSFSLALCFICSFLVQEAVLEAQSLVSDSSKP